MTSPLLHKPDPIRDTDSGARDDGGPAFPRLWTADNDGLGSVHDGMSLRDWFAGMAMRDALGSDEYQIAEGRRLLAINCYQLADAMLAERSK